MGQQNSFCTEINNLKNTPIRYNKNSTQEGCDRPLISRCEEGEQSPLECFCRKEYQGQVGEMGIS
jgi:hypothetical protein